MENSKLESTDLLPALKPCPFCGEMPTLNKHFRENIWRLTHRCPAVGPITFDWTTPESIANGWNRRARATDRNKTQSTYAGPYTLTIERGAAGLWYVTGSMHKGLLVVGHTMGEALSRVEGVWADLRVAEEEFVRAKAP